MLSKINIEQILFLDIETIPQYSNFDEMPVSAQRLWELKTVHQRKELSPEDFYEKAGIWAEFGKIICISVGRIKMRDGIPTMRIKSFSGDNEKEILINFSDLLIKVPQKALLCAHNGKEFDFPYLCRRLLINGIPIPSLLNTLNRKPWEIPHLDTMEMWKFGDYKNYTSLELLAEIFQIETPKKTLDGSLVKHTYYQLNDLKNIVEYCQKDVATVAHLLLKWKGLPSLEEDHITIVD